MSVFMLSFVYSSQILMHRRFQAAAEYGDEARRYSIKQLSSNVSPKGARSVFWLVVRCLVRGTLQELLIYVFAQFLSLSRALRAST